MIDRLIRSIRDRLNASWGAPGLALKGIRQAINEFEDSKERLIVLEVTDEDLATYGVDFDSLSDEEKHELLETINEYIHTSYTKDLYEALDTSGLLNQSERSKSK